MYTLIILLVLKIVVYTYGNTSEEDVELYYYATEESERNLAECGARQACSVLLQRYWRPAALVRLCRCARRDRCDASTPHDRRFELNNRAYFQFCQPITDWPICAVGETALTIDTAYDRMNPDELEEQHHKNIQLWPPTVTFDCVCRTPNYWKQIPDEENEIQKYRCSSLPLCTTGEVCGSVSNDLFALYQSCLCPKRHICVQSGGIARLFISEVLYNGLGWKANCQRMAEDSYEDY